MSDSKLPDVQAGYEKGITGLAAALAGSNYIHHSTYYYPHTGDRQQREAWEAAGGRDIRERAQHKVREILKTHWPTPIPAGIDAAIRKRFEILLPPELAGVQDD